MSFDNNKVTIPKGYITKTDGQGNIILVRDPYSYNNEGNYKKIRKKITNFTPKKKKRK